MDNQNQITQPAQPFTKKTFPIIPIILIVALLLIAIPFMLQSGFFVSKKEMVVSMPLVVPSPKQISNRDALPLIVPQVNQQFSCPTIVSFCKQQSYFMNGALEVWTHEEPVFAVFNGKLSSTEEGNAFSKQSYHHVIVMRSDGLEAHYFFTGDLIKNVSDVKEGDKIATTNGAPIALRKDKSLIFEVRKVENGNVTKLKLNAETFK